MTPPPGPAQLLILGTSKFSVEVADLASDCPEFELVAFVENLDPARCESTLEGLPVIWIDEAAELRDTHLSLCGLGTTKRSRYTEQAAALGLRFATLVHPTARVSSRSTLGEGTVVSAGAVVGAHTHAGRHVLISAGVLVGHHTRLDDHASLMIGANVAGSCEIGSGVYIGMGARVLDHRRVAAGAVVGAGAVVASDLPERVLALGVPARIVQEDVEAP
jgi:sugar O-acyltransferase (sialic acid O-acetyltransferase NeuD family)